MTYMKTLCLSESVAGTYRRVLRCKVNGGYVGIINWGEYRLSQTVEHLLLVLNHTEWGPAE